MQNNITKRIIYFALLTAIISVFIINVNIDAFDLNSPMYHKSTQNKQKVELLLIYKPLDLIRDIKVKEGDEWFVLMKTKAGIVLKKEKLDIYNDENYGDSVGINEEDEKESLDFLIRGLPSLKEGLIKTYYYSDKGYNESNDMVPGKQIVIKENVCQYKLFAKGKTENYGPSLYADGYALILDGPYGKECHKKRKQQIINQGNDVLGLLWSGDLDNDGRLDLIFKFDTGEGGGSYNILFLSSFAKKNEIVGYASEATGWGD